MTLAEKEKNLEDLIGRFQKVIVAYSGGVDSSYLAFKSYQVLGAGALAITGDSASVSSHQRQMAERVAAQCGFAHEIIHTEETGIPEYRANPSNRCYFCKDELFRRLQVIAHERGYAVVVDGLNVDDLSDVRPGRLAAEMHGVRSPLVDAGLNKEEIRELSRRAGLPTSEEPASACLASRFPFGIGITEEKLQLVDRGEEALRNLGFRIFRVRHHDAMVRLEFGPQDLERALDVGMARELSALFKRLGYKFVTLDLEGYRTGSSNDLLTQIK
jgi:uncharacterized protein